MTNMPLVMNMAITSQDHHLSTEKVGDNLQIVPKSTAILTYLAYPRK